MISTFAERNTESGLMEDRLSPEELAEAEELARTKYGTREWIYTLPCFSGELLTCVARVARDAARGRYRPPPRRQPSLLRLRPSSGAGRARAAVAP
jgi:hypothetical protein